MLDLIVLVPDHCLSFSSHKTFSSSAVVGAQDHWASEDNLERAVVISSDTAFSV